MFTDVTGRAIADYYEQRSPAKLWIYNRYGPKEQMPVATYFRGEEDMPELELIALQHCYGKVLDIGAGAGSHSLLLQKRGIRIDALDISPLSVQVMKARGVLNAICDDISTYRQTGYDTLLLLMNGIGLAGSTNGLKAFLNHIKPLLNPGGQVLLDSSDVAYLYEHKPRPSDHYYGEIDYQYSYKSQKTSWFSWLYIDYPLLADIAAAQEWNIQMLYQDPYDQYLARLTPA